MRLKMMSTSPPTASPYAAISDQLDHNHLGGMPSISRIRYTMSCFRNTGINRATPRVTLPSICSRIHPEVGDSYPGGGARCSYIHPPIIVHCTHEAHWAGSIYLHRTPLRESLIVLDESFATTKSTGDQAPAGLEDLRADLNSRARWADVGSEHR